MPEFYDRYINLVPENMALVEGLKASRSDYHEIKNLLEKHQDFRYEKDKWSPKDILQHVIDNERIQAYRALAISRCEENTLYGYDQNAYAEHTNASQRSIPDLLEEFRTVRDANIYLFKSFTNSMLLKEGVCSNIKVTPLALGLVNIGHAIHHLKVLCERYF